MKLFRLCLPILLFLGATAAFAGPVNYNYANWTSATNSSSMNPVSVSGTISIGANTVNITYSGDVAFAQVGSGGTDYYVPASVYTNSQVANVPTNNNIIALSENPAYTDTLTFSSPLQNPILDIVSLGQGGDPVSYNFTNATPIILSQGSAYWGGCSSCMWVTGNTLSGTEGSGVIEFVGNYSSISWTTTNGEYWNGFTVGVQGLAPTGTPEPSSLLLLGAGLAGCAAGIRRKLAR